MNTILILTNHDGGLFHFRREVLQALLAENFRVVVCVPEGVYRNQLEEMGCLYEPTEIERHGMNPIKDFSLFLKYGKLIKKYQPSVILTYTIKPNIYGALQARIRKVPYLVNVTGLGMALQKNGPVQKLLLFLYRISMKKAACVFFQNTQNLDFMKDKRCIHTRTRLLPGSGVNLKEFVPLPYPDADGEVMILNITRIMKDKGVEELLAAAENLHRRYPRVIFEIIGDYEEDSRSDYESKVEELQKNGIIRYYGYQKDVKRFLNKCHLVVHPTYHEGMSNVLLEAAASARPVAASDISGCREIFEDGKGGIAFKPQSTEALVQALEQFLELNADRKKEMGAAARSYVEEHFDREIVIQAYMEEIRRAISDSGKDKK